MQMLPTLSNAGLVDKLKETGYIKSSSVEGAFRSVDRGAYVNNWLPTSRNQLLSVLAVSVVLPSTISLLLPVQYVLCKKEVYDKDKPWEKGELHLSAPIIHATVLENLELQPGMYFLNVGSGTGYLSTMCGLLIGKKGLNHGIDVIENVVNYARKKVEEFLKTQTQKLDFCHPEFILGNCMAAAPAPQRYDRIYVGARCTDESVGHFINMLKVGGICIVPIGDSLVKITRTSGEDERKVILILTTAFPDLIYPEADASGNELQLPSITNSLAFQALAQIPGVTVANLQEWLERAKLVLPGDQIYDDICQYIGNSQERLHKFGIKVLNIVRLIRKNDPPLDQPEKLRMLLWHGTKVQSVPSILQHGFQPPRPAGQMFGPGIYFADRASKSANYSAKETMKPNIGEIGYMFLCEVIVGESYNAKVAHHDFTEPPTITTRAGVTRPCDSVKCTGENVPDMRDGEVKIIGPNHIILPFSKTIKNTRFDSYTVKFNEFTVYSGDRCKPNHLVEFQFTPSPEQYLKTCMSRKIVN